MKFKTMGNKSNPAILFFYAPELLIELQKNTFWEFDNKEDHFKYRNAVMQTYKYGNFPVFDGCNHMQYQIRDPKGFAEMLEGIIESGKMKKQSAWNLIKANNLEEMCKI